MRRSGGSGGGGSGNALLGGGTVLVGAAVATRVTRGGQQGGTQNTNLLELGVHTLNVALGGDAQGGALGGVNVLALADLAPRVRHGEDGRAGGGGDEGLRELVHPLLHKEGRGATRGTEGRGGGNEPTTLV